MGRVAFTHVTKRFGDVVAVDDLTVVVNDGEFFVLLGPSGCGKSTALRMVAGLEEVTEGVIEIGDRAVNRVPPKDRDIAMVFQSYALYPHMTVRRNIEFPLRTREVPRAERNTLVEHAAEILGLDTLLDRKPSQLSGGQRQRVALARAIVRQPEVFLMDEPLSNLDAKLRASTRVELVALQRTLATTVVYVTHDQVEAMTMGDRIAIMFEGALQQVGAPQDVYDKPANRFVAEFIGTPPMNTFAARLVSPDTLAIGAGTLPLDGVVADPATSEVIAGVRPEHLVVTSNDAGSEPGDAATTDGLVGTVTLVESLGHERHTRVRLDTGTELVVRQPASAVALVVGRGVRLRAKAHDVHLYDQASGIRLARDV